MIVSNRYAVMKGESAGHPFRGNQHTGGGGGGLPKVDNLIAKPGQYSAEAIASAKATRDKAAAAEPETTETIMKLADKHGGQVESLEYRLKSEESLARKIDGEKDDFGGDTEKTAEAMSDVTRYTVTFDEGGYVGSSKAIVQDLESQGMTARVKNYWKGDDPYQGVNIAVTRKDGSKFELQLHTPKSLVIKAKCHKEYEKYRVATSPQQRYKHWNAGVRLANQIPVPKGDILGFGDIKVQTFSPKALYSRYTEFRGRF